MGEDERAGADGHESALFAGIGLLELGEILDKLDRLGLLLEHVIHAHTTRNDEDVVFLEVFVSIFKVDVSFNSKA